MTANYKNRGFTMVEVLVSVVILAIGLLGLAGLQARNLQFNYSAYERSQATLLAYDIIDRMRANLGQAVAQNYRILLNQAPPVDSQSCQAAGANCNAAALAAYDLSQWKCSLGRFGVNGIAASGNCGNTQGALSQGDGSVTFNGNLVTVTITWIDDRSVTGPNSISTFTASTVL